MAGRTMTIKHKGLRVLVAEGHDDRVVLRCNGHDEPTEKKFPAACRQAVSWLLANAGEMRGDYNRDH